MYRLLFVSAAFLIAGCATHSPEADAQAQAQAEADDASRDSAKCQSYGLQPATTEFEKCLSQLADKRAQAESDQRLSADNSLLGKPPWGNWGAPPSN